MGLEKNYNDVPTRTTKSVTISPFVMAQYGHWTDKTDGQTDMIGKTISRSACFAC